MTCWPTSTRLCAPGERPDQPLVTLCSFTDQVDRARRPGGRGQSCIRGDQEDATQLCQRDVERVVRGHGVAQFPAAPL